MGARARAPYHLQQGNTGLLFFLQDNYRWVLGCEHLLGKVIELYKWRYFSQKVLAPEHPSVFLILVPYLLILYNTKTTCASTITTLFTTVFSVPYLLILYNTKTSVLCECSHHHKKWLDLSLIAVCWLLYCPVVVGGCSCVELHNEVLYIGCYKYKWKINNSTEIYNIY